MLNHLIDPQKCIYAPPEIRNLAQLEKIEWKQRLRGGSSGASTRGGGGGGPSESPLSRSPTGSQASYAHTSPPPPLPPPPPPPPPPQFMPGVVIGDDGDDDIDAPFTRDDEEVFHLQVARATVSAGLPDHWIEDPEVIKLLRLLHPAVTIPSAGHVRRLRELIGWG